MDDFFKRLLDGDATVWQKFLAVMEPELVAKFRHVVVSDEDAQNMAHDVIACLIANIPKLTAPAHPL
jgi:hypothetical protein